MDRDAGGSNNSSTIGVRDDVRGEKLLELSEIAFLRGGDQGYKKPLSLDTICRSPAPVSNVLAGTRDELARVGLGGLKDFRYLAVGVIEGFAEDIGRAFSGRQLFEQQQHGEFESLATFSPKGWVGASVHGLGKPRPNVSLASGARRLREVDSKARRGGDKKRGRVLNGSTVGRLPAQPNVLHDVLGLGDGPEHTVGDAEETRAHA